MKQHVKLKLQPGVKVNDVYYWAETVTDKAKATTKLHPDIDAIFAEYQLPVWTTREYKPQNQDWSESEIASAFDRIFRIILQKDQELPSELINKLSHLSIVEYAHYGLIGQTELPVLMQAKISSPIDMQSRKAIYLDQAHSLSEGMPEVTVAILDTGIDLSHPELRENLLTGFDFVDIIDGADQFIGDYLDYDDVPDDEVGHGTHVAGIIAAKGLNMPLGVVPKCRILPVRVLGAMQRGNSRVGAGLVDNINAGIKWAIDKGADVINMSLGIEHMGGGLPHDEVVEYARRKDVTIVAASGNDGKEHLYYPGALPHVIAVGAIDESGSVTNYSTYGQQVSFVAPGTNIYSTYIGHSYAFSTGTSHATPFVAGAVALLKSYALGKKRQRLTDSQIKHILKHTADKVDTYFKNRKGGYGKLNLIDALKLLEEKLR